MISDRMKKCMLCNSEEYRIIHHGVRENPDVDVLKCECCGLVRLSKSIDDIDEYYNQSGMHKEAQQELSSHYSRSAGYDDDNRRFEYIKNAIENKRYLDFGCGFFGCADKARFKAESIYAVEPDRQVRSFLQNDGITCFSSIDELETELTKKIDVITMFHVLEHLENPVDVLKRLGNLLTDDGRIIIEVPNADDALLSLYESDAFADFTYWICHLYLFDNNTLKQTIKKAGLKVNFIHQIQRYPLSNHLHWLSKGGPGGHVKWSAMNDALLDKLYGEKLASMGIADTIIAEVSKQNTI